MFSIDDWSREGEELRAKWLRPEDLKRVEERVRTHRDTRYLPEEQLLRKIQSAGEGDAREIESLDLLFWMQMLVAYMTNGQYALTPKEDESFSGYLERVEELLHSAGGKDPRIPDYRDALGRTTPHVVLLFSRYCEEQVRDAAATNLERLLNPYAGEAAEAGERVVVSLQAAAKNWGRAWIRGFVN